MTDRHYKERFDDEMTGVHKARRDAELEEEEWKREEEERDFQERWEEAQKKTLMGCFRTAREPWLNLRDEIVRSFRLKKCISVLNNIIKKCSRVYRWVRPGRE